MKKILDKNNYIVVDLITEKEAKDYFDNLKQYYLNSPNSFYYDEQCPLSLSIHNYKPFLELLINKIPFMNEIMEEQVLPTYTYARIYQNKEILAPHTDRFACEISMSLHLWGDKQWPIWFTDPQGNKIPVNLKPGQVAIYKGIISKHWRDAYEGTEYGQVFLHYVKSNGENWRHYFDKVQ